MSRLIKYRTPFTIIIAAIILTVAISAIFWARGFKPNIKTGSIDRTGLIVATSIPTGAQVFLDGRLTSATNTNIAFLDPKTYKVRIEKDGYTTWEKDIVIRADLATEIKALLFPLAPEIKPLTTTGAVNPLLSPNGSQIIYGSGGQRGGAYILPMSDRPFPFRQDLRLLVANRPGFDFAQAQFLWSPDSKQAVAQFKNAKGETTANLLIDIEKSDQEPRDITASLNSTLATWQQDLEDRAQTQALTVPETVKSATAAATPVVSSQLTVDSKDKSVNSALPTGGRELTTENLLNYFPTGMTFSPDEEKILYQNKDGQYKIYDLKTKEEFTLPTFADLQGISWYPDSAHLVVAQNPPAGGQISIIETDGANQMTVFSGKFENSFVFAHPSGSRLIILTTLTQTEGTPPNLYSINLR